MLSEAKHLWLSGWRHRTHESEFLRVVQNDKCRFALRLQRFNRLTHFNARVRTFQAVDVRFEIRDDDLCRQHSRCKRRFTRSPPHLTLLQKQTLCEIWDIW